MAQRAKKEYTNATKYEEDMLDKALNQIDEIIGEKNLPRYALANKVQIGDYVAYDPTSGVTDNTKLTYISPIGTGAIHGNGWIEQTFTADSNIEWRVLSKDETTGEVVLISAELIYPNNEEIFVIGGPIGYLYAEQELNEICKIYGYGTGADTTKAFTYETGDAVEGLDKGMIIGSGARSINVNDINKITGYDPSKYTNERNGIIYKYGNPYTHLICHPTKKIVYGLDLGPDYCGKTLEAKERTDIYTTYSYIVSNLSTNIKREQYEMLFNREAYFLASRGVSSYSDMALFCVGVVCETGIMDEVEVFFDYAYLGDDTYNVSDRMTGGKVCPIVYLKPDIETTGQDENGVWQIKK